ncbi:MAG: tRNA (adenine(22)-N(1))-methyltransferase [Candidatus Fimenecus sp.]
MLKLTNRLQLVADCVNPCDSMADIGTDHAYLPVWCLLNGKARSAVAADINPKPLSNARKTVEEYELNDKITLRLSDGLKNITADEVQEIVVAGMGGNQIADMISQTPWLRDQSIHLVLQPMTHFEDVRRALCENGFVIESEQTTAEGERLYVVISARYSHNKKTYPEWYYYAGELPRGKGETDAHFLEKIITRLKKRGEALAEKNGAESQRLFKIIEGIENECRKNL